MHRPLNNLMSLLLGATALLLAPRCASAQTVSEPSSLCADGELLVKWRNGPASIDARHGNARCGGEVRRNFDHSGWQWVKLPVGLSVAQGMALYRSEPEVLAVEPNLVAQASRKPNDPQYASQWNLPKVSAPAAWDITTGSTNVVVAVIDTGVEYTHPDLSKNIWRNPGEIPGNGIDDDGNGYIDDVHGINAWDHNSDPMDLGAFSEPNSYIGDHGTVVAGLIGAVGNNGTGISGVNWSVQMMPLRWLGGIYTEETLRAWLSGLLECYEYAIDMKRRGVNLRAINASLALTSYSQALADAVERAGKEGILSVCAAGNAGFNTDRSFHLPSGLDSPYVISVAATDINDQLASFSNFGRSTVDLAAPGEDVGSTIRTNDFGFGASGTSFAAPHVAGAVALLAAADPSATWAELKAAILQSVDAVPALTGKLATGGRLNIARALQVLTNRDLPPIVLGAFPGSVPTAPTASVEIRFNQPMDRSSVEAALLIEPKVTGTFTWSEEDRVCRVTPDLPFLRTNYSARILGSARSATGKTIDGNFNRQSQGSPADDFVWTFQLPLANDTFADAQGISSTTGSLSATTMSASYEMDEPYHADSVYMVASIWYRWQSEADSWVTFRISKNGYDTLLAAYTGDKLNTLMAVAGNDNDGDSPRSRISFHAKAGASYLIAIAGKSSNTGRFLVNEQSMGTFTLDWFPTPPPFLSSFSPISGFVGSTVTLTGTNFTGVTGVFFNGQRAEFTNAVGNFQDRRLIAVVPPGATSGKLTVVSPLGTASHNTDFTVLPNPSLSIRKAGFGQIELAWPAANTSGFVVEVTPSLTTPSWKRVMAPVNTVAEQKVVSLSTSNQEQFYRIRKP